MTQAPGVNFPEGKRRDRSPVFTRPVPARSVQYRGDVSEFDTLETGPDACPPYDHRGIIAVGCAWLAFYVIVAIHHLMTSGSGA